MSATTSYPWTENQTSNVSQTYTDRNDLTTTYHIDNDDKLTFRRGPPLGRWPYFTVYGYGYWSVVVAISLMGLVGNLFLFIMMTDKKLSCLSYSVYLKFLAVSDSVLIIIRLIQENERTFNLPQLTQTYTAVCKISFSLKIFVMLLSPWLVVGLALDRYVCVCFPLKRERFCSRLKAIIVCSTMVGLSVVLLIPFLVDTELIGLRCIPSDGVKNYYVVIRLAFSSFLPCLLILILNVFTVIGIRRSQNFRKKFMTSRSGSTNQQPDGATRPLVLVSMLAFVTLLPVSVTEAIQIAVLISKTHNKALLLSNTLWPVFVLVYMLNFGQNFYILLASSSNYRNILKRKLGFGNVKETGRTQHNLARVGRDPPAPSPICRASRTRRPPLLTKQN